MDEVFNEISMMCSRVLLDWAEEEPSIREKAEQRAFREREGS
jgi:hypothetical protein